MATIFTRIAQGEIPSYKVAENEDYYAFLDISPLALGHTLVIPKQFIGIDTILYTSRRTDIINVCVVVSTLMCKLYSVGRKINP